jgi:hypothetical protein
MNQDNKSLWQEICYILQDSVDHSIDESKYEQKIISCLVMLGWLQSKKEIELKKPIRIGSMGTIIPDIIVRSFSENMSFVVDEKRWEFIEDYFLGNEKDILSYSN